MKKILACLSLFVSLLVARNLSAAPATLLFEDDFNRGIPGWTAVQPPGNYIDGPMRWQYDIVSAAYVENSNIYTDAAAASTSGTAVMLINDTVAPAAFTYTARLTAGDDDGFGLVFGYKDSTNFFRVSFGRQARTGFPWTGWNVDQKTNNLMVALFGAGVAGFTPSFVNAVNRPFDVTISVDATGKFSLTVVDDPVNAPIEYKLVENQTLPAPADGKVGFFQWGQSGNTPRAFRIQTPVLTPTPLVLTDQNQLTNWTSVATVRADGSGIGNLPGMWSLALGVNGPLGVLLENSDIAPGNDAAGQVDFPTPALVTGQTTWSNYVVRARMFSNDDDGYGLILRYQDPQNFYRVAWRFQNSATGVRRGLSVQKAVGGVFEELFFEETPQYLFPGNVPFEVSAAIIDQSLQVLVRGNLNTTPTTFIYGPIDMGGSSPTSVLTNGQTGVFSWAMNRLEVDWFRVYAVDGVPIEVASAFGPANPPTGINSYPLGTVIDASVPEVVEDAPGRRRRPTGWTGFGSVPTSGTTNQVTFTLNAISSISWEWLTEYRLVVSAGSGGTVSAPAAEWQMANSVAAVTATPNAGFVFTGWSGSSAAVSPSLTLLMAQPFTLTANFKADTDNDGLPDDWENTNFSGLAETAAGDPDTDGVSNAAEYQRGSNPKFKETEILANPFTSRWENVEHDPALPGVLIVRDFGAGFRGVWENSNDYREADTNPFLPVEQRLANVSFEGPRIIIRTNVWNPIWTNIVASAIFSVADNDGNCVYFRYQNESNWYRVTVNGNDAYATWRAPKGVSVQKRVNGTYTQIAGPDESIYPDPTEAVFYKRFRVTVITTNDPNFEVRVAGWNTRVEPAVWDPDIVIQFSDPDLTSGRFGVGTWGQSGVVANGGAILTNPVDAGVLIEDVVVEVDGTKVFEETWDTVPLPTALPAGWSDPANAGTWNQSAHGSIIQLSTFGPATTATAVTPKADAESANLIGPPVSASSYLLEMQLHPFDSDGIGFIYDYVDANNYSRVLFVSAASADGRMPQGLNVSRKINGVWSDVLAGDLAFVYTPGLPFTVEFARNAQEYRLNARNSEGPGGATWTWAAVPGAPASSSFGLASWQEVDAHYDSLRVLALTGSAPQEISISNVTVTGGNLVLTINNPGGGAVNVETRSTLAPGSWTSAAQNVTTPTWSVPLNTTPGQTFYRLSK